MKASLITIDYRNCDCPVFAVVGNNDDDPVVDLVQIAWLLHTMRPVDRWSPHVVSLMYYSYWQARNDTQMAAAAEILHCQLLDQPLDHHIRNMYSPPHLHQHIDVWHHHHSDPDSLDCSSCYFNWWYYSLVWWLLSFQLCSFWNSTNSRAHSLHPIRNKTACYPDSCMSCVYR